MKILRNLLTAAVVLAMLAIGVLFSLQNESPVPLDLLVFTFEPRGLAVWVLAAFALGGALGMAVSFLILVRTRASLSSCRRQLERMREQLDKSRVEPSA